MPSRRNTIVLDLFGVIVGQAEHFSVGPSAICGIVMVADRGKDGDVHQHIFIGRVNLRFNRTDIKTTLRRLADDLLPQFTN